MSGNWKRSGWGKVGLAVCLALTLGACRTTPPGPPPPVQRVVLMWLKHSGSTSDRAKLLRAARSLRMMPGVVRVESGHAVPHPPREADRDFDLGVVITFRDRAALRRYEGDRRHGDAMERYLRPLVRRSVAYNLGSG